MTSHAHDCAQPTPRHELPPEQSTVHLPVPQARLRQLFTPEQPIVHDFALRQFTPFLHAPDVEQRMSHAKPVGQITALLHADGLTEQSTTHVLATRSHEVHGEGQVSPPSVFAASILTPESSCVWSTQKPSVQTRPAAQSACFVHA